MMKTKYSLFEILFSDKWQWVRKRSKMVWVKDTITPGMLWVKFTSYELEWFGVSLDIYRRTEGFVVEDWRVNEN